MLTPPSEILPSSTSSASTSHRPSGDIQYKPGGFPQRAIHLITWAQAVVNSDHEDVRTAFAEKVVALFDSKTESLKLTEPLVDRWACSLESHQDGGKHFHLLVRTIRRIRVYDVWKSLFEENIKVNFSNSPGTYWKALDYVLKSDKEAKLSPGHPSNGQMPSSDAVPSVAQEPEAATHFKGSNKNV